MAIDAFIYIDGREGPSLKRKGAIEIMSCQYGVNMTSSYGEKRSGGEAATGVVSPSDISVMSVADGLTPQLHKDCCTGHIYKKIKIEYEKPVGNKQTPFFQMEIEDAHLTNLSISASAENPTVAMSFAVEKVKVNYNPQDGTGKLVGFKFGGYDFAKAEEW
jgi:type VI protein secretion system component Hcp